MNTAKYKIFSLGLALLLFVLGCKKDKLDIKIDNRELTENRVNSTVRIINLDEYNQVIANGDSLTNFVTRASNGPDSYKYPGTSYFPLDGRLTKSWFIPQNLFNEKEEVRLQFALREYLGNGNRELDVSLKNDFAKPTDYFLMPHLFVNGQPEVVAVPRGVTLPSKPDHFKIRIINIGANITRPASGLTGLQEDLTGPVSLAFADGTLVDAKTNGISTANIASEYVEVPYGTYQFRILLRDGRQLPARGSEMYEFGVIDPASSTLPESSKRLTNLSYAPIKTYQPGGVYTILVAPQSFNYLINDLDETTFTYQNSFQVITDVSAAVNQTYCRIQGANALADQAVSFKASNTALGSNLAFGMAGDYSNLVQGYHKIEALDANGKVLASTIQVLRANQNYTAWLHPDRRGQPKLVLVSNDLSGTAYTGAQDDASFGRLAFNFFFHKRFLNLSVGNPYVTFTTNDGQTPATGTDNVSAATNLQPGLPIFDQPYFKSVYNLQSYQIMAYRSKPNVIPGVWASDIDVLPSDSFIANKTLYQKANRPVPVHEAGVYTVALIGNSSTNANSANKARMIIVKHTK